jgi:hypothetical protein
MNKRNHLMTIVCLGALTCGVSFASDVTTTGGTVNTIPVFTGASAIGNSIMTQSGSVVTVTGTLNATTQLEIAGNKAMTQSESYTVANIGIGAGVLNTISSGTYNTAMGWDSMEFTTTGVGNAAFGYGSLTSNTTGGNNTAVGGWALLSNQTGSFNTGVGGQAGQSMTAGSGNTLLGFNAGASLTTGDYNIEIGYGVQGTSSDAGVIRIGNSNQTSAYLAGVYGVTTGTTGAEVFIDAAGQLGTKSSSIRYKEEVQNMGDTSDKLFNLRPVTFRYKQALADGSKPVEYGLIAEEVAQIYPDMVSRNAKGQIETVQYSKLTPMLLNEVQKLRQLLDQQAELTRQLESRLAALESK